MRVVDRPLGMWVFPLSGLHLHETEVVDSERGSLKTVVGRTSGLTSLQGETGKGQGFSPRGQPDEGSKWAVLLYMGLRALKPSQDDLCMSKGGNILAGPSSSHLGTGVQSKPGSAPPRAQPAHKAQ